MVPENDAHTGHQSCSQGILLCRRNIHDSAASEYVPRLARSKRAQQWSSSPTRCDTKGCARSAVVGA